MYQPGWLGPLLIVLAVLFLPTSAIGAPKVDVKKGDRVIVNIEEAVIVDKDQKVLSKVTKGTPLYISEDRKDTEWVPVEITLNGKLVPGWISTSHVRFVSVSEDVMSHALVILIHVLVIGGIILMIVFLVRTIMDGGDFNECLLRSLSLAAGLLAYVAARVYGLSIPDILAASLNVVSPIATGLWGVAAPAATGTFVAWFCIRMMNKSEDVGKRVTLLLCAFMFTMFADVYATLAGQIGASEGKFGLPNSTFVLGVVLYTILNYRRPTHNEAK